MSDSTAATVDADFVVCMNARPGRQPPVSGSTTKECSGCGTDVWIHPTSPQELPPLCYGCALSVATRDQERPQ